MSVRSMLSRVPAAKAPAWSVLACVALVVSACGSPKQAQATKPAAVAAPASKPAATVEQPVQTEAGAILAALETGRPQLFRGELNGRVNVASVDSDGGRLCRSYSVQVAGAKETGTAVVCREADGNWRPAKADDSQSD